MGVSADVTDWVPAYVGSAPDTDVWSSDNARYGHSSNIHCLRSSPTVNPQSLCVELGAVAVAVEADVEVDCKLDYELNLGEYVQAEYELDAGECDEDRYLRTVGDPEDLSQAGVSSMYDWNRDRNKGER